MFVRNTSLGEWMVIIVFKENNTGDIQKMMQHVKESFPQLTSLLYIINDKRNDTIYDLDVHVFAGREYIIEKLEDLTFHIQPKSFFQTNTEQTLTLYSHTRDFAGLTGEETVYDLYTGVGSIANFVARKAKSVIGIESVEAAIEDAKVNAGLNNITNTHFYAGDMKDVLNDELIAKHGKADVIITDPPRAGMHEDVVNKIKEMRAEKIVYVSCNPSTQARDIAMLSDMYEVVKVQPVDMFPHTHHVENIALLKLKS
jgi:23S rRNA (uracil1939-C5)-methyltransferase